MELIENLLQLLTTFVGALLSGISYRKSGRQVYFLLLCFFTVASRWAHSTGRCICCCSIPHRAFSMCRSSAGWRA